MTSVWYCALVLRFHSHGALGNDPATYLQMARDLVQRGVVTHDFPLFTKFWNAGLGGDVFLPPGYHIVRATGIVAPNYAFGFPLLLAFAERAFGESAKYAVTPLMGALSLIGTFAVGNELWRELPPIRRHFISALAVVLLATTPKQIQLEIVTMSDVPTQFFCVLAVWCALRLSRKAASSNKAMRFGGAEMVAFAGLCGLVLGMAFLIRHSALVLMVPLAILATRWGQTRRQEILLLGVGLAIFALTIMPDLIYRTNVLGSPFAVESPEGTQLVWGDAPVQFLQMLGALFSATGFGPIVLVILFGWWDSVRRGSRFEASVLSSWIFAFVLFHAPLRLTGFFENSFRYLLPAYPAIVLSISFGVVSLGAGASNGLRGTGSRYALRHIVRYASIALAVIALGIALRSLVGPERFVARAYGWMGETTRRDLDALRQHLPTDAVIGASNQMAGAILLYTGRDVFLPGNLMEPTVKFPLLLEAMQTDRRPVYLIGDWNCSPLATADEKLPAWLANYEPQATGEEIRDLPYECVQRLYRIK